MHTRILTATLIGALTLAATMSAASAESPPPEPGDRLITQTTALGAARPRITVAPGLYPTTTTTKPEVRSGKPEVRPGVVTDLGGFGSVTTRPTPSIPPVEPPTDEPTPGHDDPAPADEPPTETTGSETTHPETPIPPAETPSGEPEPGGHEHPSGERPDASTTSGGPGTPDPTDSQPHKSSSDRPGEGGALPEGLDDPIPGSPRFAG